MPTKTSLTQAGIQELIRTTREDPAAWRKTVALIRSRPRQALHQLFNLTATQRAILYGMSDAEIDRYTKTILRAQSRLLKGEGRVAFSPDPVFAGRTPPPTLKRAAGTAAAESKFKCSCKIDVSW